MSRSLLTLCLAALALTAASVHAKLPPPSDEAKAKAAEAAAKTAHGNKVSAFQLCKSMDRTAAAYQAQAKKDGKAVKPADASATACADPGPFVYTPAPPAAPAAAAPAAPAAAVAAAPAAPAAPKK
jgi:hypothetical protein